MDRLILQESILALDAKESQNSITYEQVCENLKFYCGWNPKTEEGIKAKIDSGLSQLKNVKVRVEKRGVKMEKVEITFTMPDETPKKYVYDR